MGVEWCSLGWPQRHSLSIENPTFSHRANNVYSLYSREMNNMNIIPIYLSSWWHKGHLSLAACLSFFCLLQNCEISYFFFIYFPQPYWAAAWVSHLDPTAYIYTVLSTNPYIALYALYFSFRQHLRANITTYAYLYDIKNHDPSLPLKCIGCCISISFCRAFYFIF